MLADSDDDVCKDDCRDADEQCCTVGEVLSHDMTGLCRLSRVFCLFVQLHVCLSFSHTCTNSIPGLHAMDAQ